MTRLRVVALALVALLLGVGLGMALQRQLLKDRLAVLEAPTAADIGFLRDMMSHHEQAMEMSLIEINHGEDSQVRQTAVDILLAQRGEYVQMSEKLDAWGIDSVASDGKSMAWMGMPIPTEQMPGLATPVQMTAFKAMRGKATDVEFLRLMTVHHGSGVDMAKYAGDRTEIGLVAVLSTRMVADQRSEINDMRSYGKRLGVDIPMPAPMMNMSASTGSTGSSESADTTMMNMDHGDHKNHK
jgi:uncharacterized protein (DUF305 family)